MDTAGPSSRVPNNFNRTIIQVRMD